MKYKSPKNDPPQMAAIKGVMRSVTCRCRGSHQVSGNFTDVRQYKIYQCVPRPVT